MYPRARADHEARTSTTNGFLSALFEGGLVAVRAVFDALRRRVRGPRRAQPAQPREVVRDVPDSAAAGANAPTWDAVDEASWESFPASDPPTGWAGKDIKPPTLNGE